MTYDFNHATIEQVEHYSALFDAMPGIGYLFKTDAPRYTIVAATTQVLTLAGLGKAEVVGRGVFEVFPSNSADPNDTGETNLRASFAHVSAYKKPHQLPVQRYDVTDADGNFTERYWKAENHPVLAPDGEVAYIFHISEDITDQVGAKKREGQIKDIEKAFGLFMHAPMVVGLVNGKDYVLEMANEEAFKLWGKGAEIIGLPILQGLPELQQQGIIELFDQVRTTGKPFFAHEVPVMSMASGKEELHYFNLVYQPYYGNDSMEATGVFTISHDVTEQVKSRQLIEESHKEFQFVTDFLPQMIWLTKPDGYHYYYNKQWYDYTGLTYEETKGKGWNAVFHPDDQERAWKLWRHSLATGEPYEIEYRCRRYDGEYLWFLGRALPMRDESGKIIKWFGTCTDIDDQKRGADIMEQQVEERTRELKLVNEQLKQFSYSASHDLQEPLRKISFFLERLMGNIGPALNEEDQKIAVRILQTTDRMRTLINDLLAYSNTTLGITGFNEVDLNTIIESVMEDMEVTIIETGAEVDIQKLPTVKGDERQLRQLFQNLISNALKYYQKDQALKVVITSKLVQGRDTEALLSKEKREEPFHLIEVKDNGIGFDPDDAERIFTLFQRLHGKAEYDGTGVGLAIVQKVVDNHNGYIWAESQPGEGATFNVLLPAE